MTVVTRQLRSAPTAQIKTYLAAPGRANRLLTGANNDVKGTLQHVALVALSELCLVALCVLPPLAVILL